MRMRTLTPALAAMATGLITGSGLALTALPATAAGAHQAVTPTHRAAPQHGPAGKRITGIQLRQVRVKERAIAARPRTAPTIAKAGSKTFTVNTTEDYGLANPSGTSCRDSNTGKCSLRAAVEAADNLSVPVRIVLGKHTYVLSSAVTVTNPKGVAVVGQGAGVTAVSGGGSSEMFYVDATGSNAPSGKLSLSSLKLKNGYATYGGAIYLNDSSSGATLVLNHVKAVNNTATTYGGVIYAADYAAVYIASSQFTGNHSPGGGVMYQYWSDVNITGSSFTGNGSPAATGGSGGAFLNEYGVFDMTGGSISGNTVGDATDSGYGGAIYDEYAMETLNNVHVDGNVANDSGYGGALYGYEDIVEVNHGTMSHNRANGTDGTGGAIYVYYQNQVALHGVTMAGNKAGGTSDGYGGGAIFVYGEYYPSQLVIDSHSKITGSNNSAVYVQGYYSAVDASIVNSTLSGNTANNGNGMNGYGCGGAVCAYSDYYSAVNLEMQGDHVTGNSSVGDYGAGAVTGYSYDYTGLTAVLRHNTFSKNHAGADGYGGAVGFFSDDSYSPISVRMASNTFTANRAGTQSSPGFGGALSILYDTTLSDTGSTFSKNRAVGNNAYGGAVADYGYYGSSAWTRTRFINNSAGTNNATNDGYGGAFYSDSYAGDTFKQVTMAGNKAAYEGGGYYGDSDSYMALFRASTISGNTAGSSKVQGYGGGIFADDAVLTVENSTITGNRATSISGSPGEGGGIYYSGSRAGIRYSTVSKNYAKQGGGVYSDAYGGSFLSDILAGNRTSPTGSENDCAAAGGYAKPNSLGGNVLGKGSCVTATASGDKVTRRTGLGTLKNNGGPTKTMAISAKSPAIGRATFQIPSTDQRGHKRPGKHADAGAYERS